MHAICLCVHKIAKSDLTSSCLSLLLSAWNNVTPSGQIFVEFDVLSIFKKCDKIQVLLKLGKDNWYFI
jgi:hypothetical protein